jgi:hypothetical protein
VNGLIEYCPKCGLELGKLANDLAQFNNTSTKYEVDRILQKGIFDNNTIGLIGTVYSKKYLIKKIGIKYYICFWRRKLYLQKQILREFENE